VSEERNVDSILGRDSAEIARIFGLSGDEEDLLVSTEAMKFRKKYIAKFATNPRSDLKDFDIFWGFLKLQKYPEIYSKFLRFNNREKIGTLRIIEYYTASESASYVEFFNKAREFRSSPNVLRRLFSKSKISLDPLTSLPITHEFLSLAEKLSSRISCHFGYCCNSNTHLCRYIMRSQPESLEKVIFLLLSVEFDVATISEVMQRCIDEEVKDIRIDSFISILKDYENLKEYPLDWALGVMQTPTSLNEMHKERYFVYEARLNAE
jgi:hypothetical protein